MMKRFTQFRIFFIVAMLVASLLELAQSDIVHEPSTQLGASTIAGVVGLFVAKVSHLV